MKARTLLGSKGYTPVIFTAAPAASVSYRKAREVEFFQNLPRGSFTEATKLYFQSEVRPTALELASRILKGKFKRKEVAEVHNGYRIISLQMAKTLRRGVIDPMENRNNARLRLLTDIHSLGFRVGLMTPEPLTVEYPVVDLISGARQLGVRSEDIIFINSPENAGEITISFLRDSFVQLGDTIFISSHVKNFTWENLFAWADGLKHGYSHIGFGGEVVISDKTAFIVEFNDQYLDMLRPFTNISEFKSIMAATKGEARRTLREMGKKVYSLPPIWMDIFPPEILKELGTKKRFFCLADHADFIVLHLFLENAIFFSRGYYRENRALVDGIVKKIQPKIFDTLPDEDGYPINSLRLPFGGAFMDRAAEESYKIISGHGIAVERSSEPFGNFAFGEHAGIDCSTNIVWLPPQINNS